MIAMNEVTQYVRTPTVTDPLELMHYADLYLSRCEPFIKNEGALNGPISELRKDLQHYLERQKEKREA